MINDNMKPDNVFYRRANVAAPPGGKAKSGARTLGATMTGSGGGGAAAKKSSGGKAGGSGGGVKRKRKSNIATFATAPDCGPGG